MESEIRGLSERIILAGAAGRARLEDVAEPRSAGRTRQGSQNNRVDFGQSAALDARRGTERCPRRASRKQRPNRKRRPNRRYRSHTFQINSNHSTIDNYTITIECSVDRVRRLRREGTEMYVRRRR